jgi:hypothetical protein
MVDVYIQNPEVPSGRQINAAAFSVPSTPRQGNLGRNSIRGFAFTQLDCDFRRPFRITRGINLQWRVDCFNILNHPNFDALDGLFGGYGPPFQPNPPSGLYSSAQHNFGMSPPRFSSGGPRSVQLSLRLSF